MREEDASNTSRATSRSSPMLQHPCNLRSQESGEEWLEVGWGRSEHLVFHDGSSTRGSCIGLTPARKSCWEVSDWCTNLTGSIELRTWLEYAPTEPLTMVANSPIHTKSYASRPFASACISFSVALLLNCERKCHHIHIFMDIASH